MTCFERRPRGRTKSAGAIGVFDPRVFLAEADEGGVGIRRCAAGRRDAQLAGWEEAPDTRRKRRFDVTLQRDVPYNVSPMDFYRAECLEQV